MCNIQSKKKKSGNYIQNLLICNASTENFMYWSDVFYFIFFSSFAHFIVGIYFYYSVTVNGATDQAFNCTCITNNYNTMLLWQ